MTKVADMPEITIEEVYAVMEQMSAPGQLLSYSEKELEQNGTKFTCRVYDNLPPCLRDYYMMGLQHADKDFVVSVDERFTFGETLAHVWRLAKALQDDVGIKKGDYVAIAMRNRPEWVFAFMAITSIGAVAVPLNGWWTSEEMEYGLSFCGAKHVIADAKRFAIMAPLIQKLDLQMISVKMDAETPGVAYTYEAMMANHPEAAPPTVAIAPTDPATLFYTSGSTGKPKGVLSCHRASVFPMLSWGRMALAGVKLIELKGGTPPAQTAVLNTVPLFHVTGSHAHMLISIIAGRKLVTMPKWDIDLAMQLVAREKVTVFHGVPTMAKELLFAEDREKYDLSSILEIGSGGAPRPEKDVERQQEVMPGVAAINGYGLTETNGLGAANTRNGYFDRPGSCGRPDAMLVDCRIVDPDGRDVPTGAHGEVWMKSAANFDCYLNNPEATKAALTDGWFHTGDVGRLDEDGYLYIVDRLKDIIIRGGENISCIEVENAINRSTDVAEVSVFGLPDDRLGEVVGAVIYPRPGHTLDTIALSAMLEEHIASFKIPAKFFMVDQPLPRLGTGKINKKLLREQYSDR